MTPNETISHWFLPQKNDGCLPLYFLLYGLRNRGCGSGASCNQLDSGEFGPVHGWSGAARDRSRTTCSGEWLDTSGRVPDRAHRGWGRDGYRMGDFHRWWYYLEPWILAG